MASRKLLQYIENNVVKASKNPQWRDFINKNSALLEANPGLATDFIQLHSSSTLYRELLESYNIGVNRSEESNVEASAKRVGLEVPKP